MGENTDNSIELIYLDNSINESTYNQINSELGNNDINYTCLNYDKLASDLQTEIATVKLMLNIGIIILLIISIILITQTMLFSIKDNISEYGIKKALGANEERLALDVLFDSMGYGFIAFLLAFLSSVVLSLLILNFLYTFIERIQFSLIISEKTILLCIMLSVLTSCVASIIPIIYISKKTIIEIIKFE